MNLEQWAYLAQIVGVVFVAATLVYLVIQVRHGAGLLRTENRRFLLDSDRDVLLAYIDNIDLFDKMATNEALGMTLDDFFGGCEQAAAVPESEGRV